MLVAPLLRSRFPFAGAIVDGVAWNYSYVPGYDPRDSISKVTITAPLGFSRTVEILTDHDIRPRITSVVDSLGRTTEYEYDNDVRVDRIVYPELNEARVVYDLRGNIVESRRIAKPDSLDPDIVETAFFGNDTTFCYTPNCFKPLWTRDAKGQQTDYTWSSVHGGLLTRLEPADADGRRRRTTHAYEQSDGGVWRLRIERVCLVTGSGASVTCGTAQEQVRSILYWDDSLLPSSETATDGAGGQSLRTTYSYDAAGRLLSADGPLPGAGDATYHRYDIAGRRVWEIGPLGSDGWRAAAFTTWREADDKPLKVEKGVVDDPLAPVLVELAETRHLYDARRNLRRTTIAQDGANEGTTQFIYDARNRLSCTAVRMNPAAWGDLPSSACVLGAEGTEGPDRISRNLYDAESRVLTIEKAVGTPLEQDYAAYTWSDNGQRTSVKDANGNLAGMTYDGHDRQTEWIFPSKTVPGQLSAAECDQPGADCEEYGYDANGNRTSFTKRDGSTLTYQYDALNRMTVKVVPPRAGLGAIHTRDVYYGYDVGDRQTFARFDSATGEGVTNAYDTLGRLQSSTLDMDGTARTLTYTLDAGGRRTQLSWPDARETSFSYDDAGRMQAIYQGALGSTTDLWTYTYSDHGRRVRKTARHGQYAEGLADGLGRLTSLHTELGGADNDNDTVFAYNPASQVASRAISNDAYAWTDHANVNRSYEVNGLNQYTEAGTATFEYDPNGNLTSDPGSASGASGVTAYLYDIENRLVRASSGAVTHTLLYDPLGRLYQIGGAGAGVVRFLYDGDELVAEYNGAGTLLRRYVHGAGVDDPLLWYEGADFGDQRWLMADHQGSIVAVTKAAPVLGLNSYDEYGIPAAGNQGRFQFTGQAWLPELGMYHYKSRLYSPRLGRFMQTDPIGYEDQVNLYAYVGNDPLNATDPTGMYICNSCSGSSTDGLLWDRDREPHEVRTYSSVNQEGGSGGNSNTPELGHNGGPPLQDVEGRESWISRIARGIFKAGGAFVALVTPSLAEAPVPTTTARSTPSFPPNSAQTRHIFRNARGHYPTDSPANRAALVNTARHGQPVRADNHGNQFFRALNQDGTETWVQVRNGVIQNGGLNLTPRY